MNLEQGQTKEKKEIDAQNASFQNDTLNLSDFSLFLSVIKNKAAYEAVLSLILNEKELRLREIKVEQVVLNQSGKRAIRMDAWAIDEKFRQFSTEMQNDTTHDDMRRRARYYQSLIDTPILKAGKETRYRNLPSTIIIFITQEDIFGRDLAKYTFCEQCEEITGLLLEDGTKKIFLNMSSKNGRPELVSLLQYMKYTTLENPEITVRDSRILDLDRIVTEVRQSEEWEAVKMNILEIGIQKGREAGLEEGEARKLIDMVCKKLRKEKTPEQIAEELEERVEDILAICRAAAFYAPEFEMEKVYTAWEQVQQSETIE